MLSLFVLSLACATSAVPLAEQWPLNDVSGPVGNSGLESGSRGLTGRFLHITDLHPDSHYKAGTAVGKGSCHRGEGQAKYYGSEGTDCDSPLSLINETFRWIETHLKDEIDFVVWTGDSARHDNDEKIPRTEDEVAELNRMVANKFVDVFHNGANPSIPIVPTIGNNDIMPHNIMKIGPNRWTKHFLEIWNKFVPEAQRHTFVEGGWFTSEVIPNRLAVISLNTMYLYDSNNAVDGCYDSSEPGYEHMEWLRVQLKILRERGMKAILIGHVPPARSGAKRNWDETCWQKYTLWTHQYRDVIVGSLYGHMNVDHFMLQDTHKLKILDESVGETGGSVSVNKRTDYLVSLRDQWSKMPSPPDGLAGDHFYAEDAEDAAGDDDDDNEDEAHEVDTAGSKKKKKQKKKKEKKFLKKIGGPWAERYSVSFVSPSVVPNYFPTLRVFEYNISGLEDATTWEEAQPLDLISEENPDDVEVNKKKKKKKKKKPDFEMPEPPSSSAPPGPAYSNQPLTWLGYTQYFANLTRINEQETTRFEAEADTNSKEDVFTYEVEYDTKSDKLYKLKDLTVRSIFHLASRLAETNLDAETSDDRAATQKKDKNKVWNTFVRRAFVGFLHDDDLDGLVD
ncbi:hypothetical protein ASPZODRAFT_89234 [Penicilliopsis zonata CBS 506.65]|uniref:Endopolyphosphatase n=1 Tax=Penicilliopsis zonata CBS 506.65 TaxID=1073090 RepID=A0A1L9SRL8_9EURO|nr:hypothetical protein ASPZODRAFT_89234 [Penicilliopsis zonata CBS 506.65]OJJ49764.1 hypothetical protein ASPZODRAFT_89234 [Penicilliopsis zonata CBS 506.65]